MHEQIIAILMAPGVTGAAEDLLLGIVISNIQYRVRNKTDRKGMSRGLMSVAVCVAVDEYLNMKKASGQLEGPDLRVATKQVQEGDTSTVFAIGDGDLVPERRLNSLIDYLAGERSRELCRFRRFIWQTPTEKPLNGYGKIGVLFS